MSGENNSTGDSDTDESKDLKPRKGRTDLTSTPGTSAKDTPSTVASDSENDSKEMKVIHPRKKLQYTDSEHDSQDKKNSPPMIARQTEPESNKVTNTQNISTSDNEQQNEKTRSEQNDKADKLEKE